MKTTLLFLVMLFSLSCSDNVEQNEMDVVREIEVVTSKENLKNHPDDFITEDGWEISFPVSDSTYDLCWSRSNFKDSIDLNLPLIEGGHASFPILKSQGKDFLYFENGCGNPCWTGYFLPKSANETRSIIELPIACDLTQNLVASVNNENIITLTNLVTKQTQKIKTKKCLSVFTVYCIESPTFKNDNFVYKWNDNAQPDNHTKKQITTKVECR